MSNLRTGPRGGKYRLVRGKKVYEGNTSHYCGAAKSFPVNSQKKCRAALSYSRHARKTM